jgi:hypothetical protein
MGTVIRVIFREGEPKRASFARRRGLTFWRDSAEVAFAAVYRLTRRAENREIHETAAKTCPFPAKIAPQR